MLRFRNPGTQYNTQIQVIKQLYSELNSQAYFTLDDMAIVIARGRLMTAYGYAGDAAIELSHTEQESMNSAKMNAKMYAEVFRMLGWVTPYKEGSSYPLTFTYIGVHVALSSGDCSALYEQCVLGINNPTQLTDKMSYTEQVRFFKCALRTFIDLDGIMYKHELCLGPMSVNDENEIEYQAMLQRIKEIRGNHSRLKVAFSDLANNLGMKPTPVDNCTRLPIAFMKSCNWIESITNRSLYNKSLTCLQITSHGRQVYDNISNMCDIRLTQYDSFSPVIQNALIRLGTYSMLERSNYDMSSVTEIIAQDKVTCAEILNEKDLLFSPSQTIRRQQVENALNVNFGIGNDSRFDINTFESAVAQRESVNVIQTLDLNISDTAAVELLTEPHDIEFLNLVNELKNAGHLNVEIVALLFEHYRDATQTTFYPLIATLFKIMGFNCSFSRPGDNGARWDAIIEDPNKSIPIEIKSPTEEQHLSIKAIRQALENKIILLSRKTYITTPEVTSLAVGYYLPNERAEVNSLISDIKSTYGYKIGVIDLNSLLSIAVSILLDEKGFAKDNLFELEGLINAYI